MANSTGDKNVHCCVAFQEAVAEYLIRHRSVLDVVSKLQEASARTNRAVAKAVTTCGCVQINATRQQFSSDVSYDQLKERMATHLQGELCEHCREVLESELGRTLFYVASLCNLFNLDLAEIIRAERRRIAALGVYNLT